VPAGRLTTELTPLFDQESYCEKVEQVKHYIHEGDIFQLVLANRLEAGFSGSLPDSADKKSITLHVLFFQQRSGNRRRHW